MTSWRVAVGITALYKGLCVFVMVWLARLASQIITCITQGQTEQAVQYILLAIALSAARIGIGYAVSTHAQCQTEREADIRRAEAYAHCVGRQGGALLPPVEELKSILRNDIPTRLTFQITYLPEWIASVIGVAYTAPYLLMLEGGWIALLCMIAIGLLHLIPPAIVSRYIMKYYIAAGQAQGEIATVVRSGISGFALLRLYDLHVWFIGRFSDAQKNYQRVGQAAAATASVHQALDSILLFIQQIGLLLLLGLFVSRQMLGQDVFIQAIVLSGAFYGYIQSIFAIRTQYSVYKAANQRFRQHFSKPPAELLHPGAQAVTLELSDVTIRYDDRQLLAGCTQSFPSEGIVLLTGENGAGKSSLLLALMGELPLREGEITANGISIDKLDPCELYTYCPQSPVFGEDSAQELLAMLPDEFYNREVLMNMLDAFEVTTEHLRKPMNKLSGGEQKKIALAIALSKSAPIALLDEPEASLDQAAREALIQILMERRGLVLIVSHSLGADALGARQMILRERTLRWRNAI